MLAKYYTTYVRWSAGTHMDFSYFEQINSANAKIPDDDGGKLWLELWAPGEGAVSECFFFSRSTFTPHTVMCSFFSAVNVL